MKNKDLYLPVWVLILGIVFIVGAAVLLYFSFTSPYCLIGVVLCLGLGIAAVLCWKNQWIEIVGDREFIYSTMFGRQTKYNVSQIIEIKENPDSVTLIMDSGKVHIESCAVMSKQLSDLIYKQAKLN